MIEQKILSHLQHNHSVALITIIGKSGSGPRLPGSKMFVEKNGTQHGTIGGGPLEHTVCRAAMAIAGGATPMVTEFDMRGSGNTEDTKMVCGGIQRILIEQISPQMAPLFELALDCLMHGSSGLWTIDISDPEQPERSFIDLRTKEYTSAFKGDINFKALLQKRSTQVVHIADKSIIIDPLPKSGTVILIGGGHVAREVAVLASYVDFEVEICDSRGEFSNQERFPMARATHVIPDFHNLFQSITIDEDSYLLIMTHSHTFDQEVLGQALTTSARYIGMIGSKRKRTVIYDNLLKHGTSERDLARVHCPVGIAIGSESPKEIAVSIVAELIAARSETQCLPFLVA